MANYQAYEGQAGCLNQAVSGVGLRDRFYRRGIQNRFALDGFKKC